MTENVAESDIAVGNGGERMHIANLWSYWAHLSIYRFALPMAVGRHALDAGSGTGYGSAYLARHGATEVLAFDASNEAVAYSRQRFAGDPVTYEVADFNKPLPVGDRIFDLVFSSNVFEHVGNVDGLAAECARAVKTDGVVVVAVPPIRSAEEFQADIRSRFHVHHIPPTAWYAKLSRFFSDVRCHTHIGSGIWAADERMNQEFSAPEDRVTIRETDFEFPEVTIERLNTGGGITALFVCRGPRAAPHAETLAERTPAVWRAGEAAARAIGEVQAELAAAQIRISAMEKDAEDVGQLTNVLNAERARHAEEIGRLTNELNARAATLRAVTAACSDRTLWARPRFRHSWLRRLRFSSVPLPRLREPLRRAKALIGRADRARDAGEWMQAAQNYQGALSQFPDNAPIWVQYGHALKASGCVAEAEAAYRRSLELDASVAETHLQLAQILKLRGRREEAVAAYLRAIILDPALANGSEELMDL